MQTLLNVHTDIINTHARIAGPSRMVLVGAYPEAALKAADLLERYAERDDVPEALREKARQRAKVLTARLSGKPLAELEGPITTRPVYTKQEFEISPSSQPASRPSTTTGPAE